MRTLHDHDFRDCPLQNQTAWLYERARHHRRQNGFEADFYPNDWGITDADLAWAIVEEGIGSLGNNTLLHGDYCLPNVIANNWELCGYIDLDTAGVGDRHYDLFWGLWTLHFNLGTTRYGQRFLDAYGRDLVEQEKIETVAALITFTGESNSENQDALASGTAQKPSDNNHKLHDGGKKNRRMTVVERLLGT